MSRSKSDGLRWNLSCLSWLVLILLVGAYPVNRSFGRNCTANLIKNLLQPLSAYDRINTGVMPKRHMQRNLWDGQTQYLWGWCSLCHCHITRPKFTYYLDCRGIVLEIPLNAFLSLATALLKQKGKVGWRVQFSKTVRLSAFLDSAAYLALV
jgi:hypothetical protein